MDACLLLLCLIWFFSTKPRDWLGRTSSKWPILCRVGCNTLTQSITKSDKTTPHNKCRPTLRLHDATDRTTGCTTSWITGWIVYAVIYVLWGCSAGSSYLSLSRYIESLCCWLKLEMVFKHLTHLRHILSQCVDGMRCCWCCTSCLIGDWTW